MKKKIKGFFTVLLYIVIVFSVLLGTQEVFVSVYESNDEARIDSALAEKSNSLDAVFLGPSTTYASWVAPIAFDEYGITVYSMASAAQPLFASKFMISDMRKKQPDALFIINITHYLIKYEKYLPNFLETYPLTANKLQMTSYLCSLGDLSAKARLEAFFPVLKYHGRWSEITLKDFSPKEDKYKSASFYSSFLNKKKNVGSVQQDFSAREPLPSRDYKGLIDLMNYCKKENVNVLFVIIPQGVEATGREGKQNTTISILESRGFRVLDLRRHIDDFGLDVKKDFYNAQHMNINGAEKVTRFISEYLIENYGFTDKRGDSNFSDWAKAAEEYKILLKSARLKK